MSFGWWLKWIMGFLLLAALPAAVSCYCLTWFGVSTPWPESGSAVGPDSPSWRKVRARVERTDRRSAEAYQKRLGEIKAFFDRRGAGADAFSREMLSLTGKWQMVKGTILWDDTHKRFVGEAFARHLFTAADLRLLLESVVSGYLAEVQTLENELLIDIRADIDDGKDAAGPLAALLLSDVSFRRGYGETARSIMPALLLDFPVMAGREAGSLIAGDVAAQVVIRIISSVSAEMGISGGILASGSLSSAATLGIGIGISFLIDALVDRLLKACGYDAEGTIASEVRSQLDQISSRIVEGSPGAVGIYRELAEMAKRDGIQSVREASREAVAAVERGGQLGLQWELSRLHDMRLRLRHQTLRTLLAKGGGE